jgi:hypothetical protein
MDGALCLIFLSDFLPVGKGQASLPLQAQAKGSHLPVVATVSAYVRGLFEGGTEKNHGQKITVRRYTLSAPPK